MDRGRMRQEVTMALIERTDSQIQEQVLRELCWDSRIMANEIGVEVKGGIVTLQGTVDHFARKLAAREAAHRVPGVLDVADEIQVRIPGILHRTDTDLAQAVRAALEWDVFVPEEKIQSTVSHGWVTLDGIVETLLQRDDAEQSVRRLQGIRGVVNNIRVSPKKVRPEEVRTAIEDTLERRAERAAEKIQVDVADGRVTLEGVVRNWAEKKAILGTVRHAPGVRQVTDKLRLQPFV